MHLIVFSHAFVRHEEVLSSTNVKTTLVKTLGEAAVEQDHNKSTGGFLK